MECETLGLKWTCSRLCPSRSGNGVRGDRSIDDGQHIKLPQTGLPDRVAGSGQSILAITSGLPSSVRNRRQVSLDYNAPQRRVCRMSGPSARRTWFSHTIQPCA